MAHLPKSGVFQTHQLHTRCTQYFMGQSWKPAAEIAPKQQPKGEITAEDIYNLYFKDLLMQD